MKEMFFIIVILIIIILQDYVASILINESHKSVFVLE